MNENVMQKRLSWRLAELPPVTGLSLPFWRKMVIERKIRSRKPAGGAIVILDEDLKAFLAGEDKDETRDQDNSLVAA